MISFEYVASGMGHTLITQNYFKQPEVIALIQSIFKKLHRANDSDFSLLFNAFTEKKFGPIFKEHYAPYIHQIHSDSGGLQMVTLGKTMTSELYAEVYKTQGSYSDVAMSFDEIPLQITGERSHIGDISNRRFDTENLEEYAKKSAYNLWAQIDAFCDQGVETLPFLIAHGNCRDTYMKWVDTIYKTIPKDRHQYIGGIAVSGASLGKGAREDIQRAAYINEFLAYNDKIHMLGVGSIRRLLPIVLLDQNGFYCKPFHLSYDSSTQTSAVSRASFFINWSDSGLGRYPSRRYEHVFEQAGKLVDYKELGVDQTFFQSTMMKKNYDLLRTPEKGVYNVYESLRFAGVLLGWFGAYINEVTKTLKEVYTGREAALAAIRTMRLEDDLQPLYAINSPSDFDKWFKNYGHHVDSRKISCSAATNLDAIFG